MPIPKFNDGYYLPRGIHESTWDEVKGKFVYNDIRQKCWNDLEKYIKILNSYGVFPSKIVLNGSFVTGRENIGDIDLVLLIDFNSVYDILINTSEDKDIINTLLDSNQKKLIRKYFSIKIDAAITFDEDNFSYWCNLYKRGTEEDGGLRPPDPCKDPSWVEQVEEKGVILLKGGEFNG